MPTLAWSDALTLELPMMDEPHREFVALLARVETCDDEALPAAWRSLLEQTEAHFAREDAWMAQTRFAARNAHAVQHKVVLRVLREGQMQVDRGEIKPVRLMVRELAIWFPQHLQTMDAALALHLRSVGFTEGA